MPQDGFTSHLPAILAATTATVGTTILTSYLGYGGTIAGVTLTSLLTGGGAWYAEKWYRTTAAKTRALAEARRRKGRNLTSNETQIISKVVEARHATRGFPWKTASLSAAVVLLSALAVIFIIELGTGSPISATVRGQSHAHGLLAPEQQPSYTPSQAPAPSYSPRHTNTPVPAATSAPVLTPAPTTPAATVPPTAPPSSTPAPVTTTPIPSQPATTPAAASPQQT